MSTFAAWRKRREAREAARSGDPWVCPYCREVHPAFEVGGTRFGFGYPSVKLACCGRVAFLLKDPKTGDLLRFTRIGDGNADWMPKEAYFRWVEESAKARGRREGTPHAELLAQEGPRTPRAPRAAGEAGVPAAEMDVVIPVAPATPAPPPGPAAAAAPARFVAVAKEGELAPGAARVVEVQGQRIALFRLPQGYAALADACPHGGQSLAAGSLEDGALTCHGHGWRFDVATGACENRPDRAARSYPVKVEGGAVLVGL